MRAKYFDQLKKSAFDFKNSYIALESMKNVNQESLKESYEQIMKKITEEYLFDYKSELIQFKRYLKKEK